MSAKFKKKMHMRTTFDGQKFRTNDFNIKIKFLFELKKGSICVFFGNDDVYKV